MFDVTLSFLIDIEILQTEADTGFSERGGVACPMSGCLASGHFLADVWLFSFLFFLGGGGEG